MNPVYDQIGEGYTKHRCADRRIVEPWLAMWLPNILVTGAGVLMLVRGVHVRRVVRWELLARKIPGRLGNHLAKLLSAGNAQQ